MLEPCGIATSKTSVQMGDAFMLSVFFWPKQVRGRACGSVSQEVMISFVKVTNI